MLQLSFSLSLAPSPPSPIPSPRSAKEMVGLSLLRFASFILFDSANERLSDLIPSALFLGDFFFFQTSPIFLEFLVFPCPHFLSVGLLVVLLSFFFQCSKMFASSDERSFSLTFLTRIYHSCVLFRSPDFFNLISLSNPFKKICSSNA